MLNTHSLTHSFKHALIYWATSSIFSNLLLVNLLSKLGYFFFYFFLSSFNSYLSPLTSVSTTSVILHPSPRVLNQSNITIGILANIIIWNWGDWQKDCKIMWSCYYFCWKTWCQKRFSDLCLWTKPHCSKRMERKRRKEKC
jgi:hypothetical protein